MPAGSRKGYAGRLGRRRQDAPCGAVKSLGRGVGVGEGDVGDGGGVGARGRRVGARGGRWWCVEGEARTQEAGRQRRRGGASAAVRAEGRAVGGWRAGHAFGEAHRR